MNCTKMCLVAGLRTSRCLGKLQYLADDVQLVVDSGRHLLRSASDRTCVIPRTHNSFGDSFSAAGPRVWNALHQELCQNTSFGQFSCKLKSHLFV